MTILYTENIKEHVNLKSPLELINMSNKFVWDTSEYIKFIVFICSDQKIKLRKQYTYNRKIKITNVIN